MNSDLDYLLSEMRTREVRFCYVKADNSLRDARGTLAMELIPTEHWPKGNAKRSPSPIVFTYFDTDKGEWRSMRRDRFVGVIG